MLQEKLFWPQPQRPENNAACALDLGSAQITSEGKVSLTAHAVRRASRTPGLICAGSAVEGHALGREAEAI